LEILFGVLTEFMVYSMEKLATFGFVVGDYLPRKLTFISENF